MIGEEGVIEATRLMRYGGGDLTGDLDTGDLSDPGRLGSFGGTVLRLAMAFSQSSVIMRSVAGLAKDAVDTFS